MLNSVLLGVAGVFFLNHGGSEINVHMVSVFTDKSCSRRW